jgi:hypothetical protein
MTEVAEASGFLPVRPATDTQRDDVWASVRGSARAARVDVVSQALDPSALEIGMSVLDVLEEAPPRTMHIPSIVRSSPLPPGIRAMIERRDFSRAFDHEAVDLTSIAEDLPGLDTPSGEVTFLADTRSFEQLRFSVDALLQHRQRLILRSITANPRRNVFVLGAGPGGLMTAVQLRLRGHGVVVCEQRDAYTRNRYVAVYKDVAHLLAALGFPEGMTYDFSHYRGKRGMMLADLQTFFHAVALKLGVVIYTGAVARDLSADTLGRGEVELVRSMRRGTAAAPAAAARSAGLTRWSGDMVARVRSNVTIRFDTIVEATGGRSGLREALVGADNVVPLMEVARSAAVRDPSLASFFEDPDDHTVEFVGSDYGCPPELRAPFYAALTEEGGAGTGIPTELPCFVSNIDASVLTTPVQATETKATGLGAAIDGKELDIPPDWVLISCNLTDGRLTRYQIEGPLPQTFEFGGRRLPTREVFGRINPLSLLVRLLYAMGVPFEAVDRRELVSFYEVESGHGDASDIVATWTGTFQGLRIGGDEPKWIGAVPDSTSIEYAILGEALQNAWYRFGVGVDDTFAAACRFAEGLDMTPEDRRREALRFERIMLGRSVQVVFHLYAVAQHPDQGVLGAVLTEYAIEEQRETAATESRLREAVQHAAEMLATESDVGGTDPLLATAVDNVIGQCGERVRRLITDVPLPADQHAAVQPLLTRLADGSPTGAAIDAQRREARLVELALGQYAWTGRWLRVCALCALDRSSPTSVATVSQAAADPDPVVADTALAVLRTLSSRSLPLQTDGGQTGRLPIVDRVQLLARVGLFASLSPEALVDIAALLAEREAVAGERIVTKGEPGECLYVIVEGAVRVHDGDRVIRHLGPHEHFGELSFIESEPRSADVTADEPTRLLRLDGPDFVKLLRDHADIAVAITRVLSRWLRSLSAENGVA